MTEFIITPSGEKIAIQILKPTNNDVSSQACGNKKLVFLEHGLAGYKEEGMMQTAAKAFLEVGYTAVLFDARYGLGESDGALEQANFTHFIEDLNTVIEWAKEREFFTVPFALCGHSLGAGACLHYAIQHTDDVCTVVSMSAVISGRLLLESYMHHKPDFIREWQVNRLLFRQRSDFPDKKGYISYAHMEDAMQYDLIRQAPNIKASVLVLCGDRDISSTISINTALYDSLVSNKKMEVISNCGHTYQTVENKKELYSAIFDWLNGF